jgi:adenylate cyclase
MRDKATDGRASDGHCNPRRVIDESLNQVLDRRLPHVPHDTEETADEELAFYARAFGVDPQDPGVPADLIRDALAQAEQAGLDGGALIAIAQAYSRGIGRIAAAEAEIVRRRIREEPAGTRGQALERLLTHALPLSLRLLEAIHRSRLRRELVDNLAPEVLEEGDAAVRTIALVDIVSSTAFLAEAGVSEAELMADAIYAAARRSVIGRRVAPVKFAGDGVFLLGRDPEEVITAALLAIHDLDGSALPVRCRGGLAEGPVVGRAGDYFGITVNLAQRLVEEAPVGALLAEKAAVPELPSWVVGVETNAALRGVPAPVRCLALRTV